MALNANDVFVVQKQAGGAICKVTASALNDYFQAGDTVVYKGVGDFTNVAENPAAPNNGDLWVNNAANPGTFAWLPDPGSVTVQPGDRCIYNGSGWDIISSGGGDIGVETITATAPIEVNLDDPSEPNISILDATDARFGAVQLATDTDITNQATNRVVTAAQLEAVDAKVDGALSGGVVSVQGVDPIETRTTGGSATVNSPEILIKDAAVGQKGAITKFDTTVDIGGPIDSDQATWETALDDTGAVSMKAVGSNFLLSDFTQYPDA